MRCDPPIRTRARLPRLRFHRRCPEKRRRPSARCSPASGIIISFHQADRVRKKGAITVAEIVLLRNVSKGSEIFYCTWTPGCPAVCAIPLTLIAQRTQLTLASPSSCITSVRSPSLISHPPFFSLLLLSLSRLSANMRSMPSFMHSCRLFPYGSSQCQLHVTPMPTIGLKKAIIMNL